MKKVLGILLTVGLILGALILLKGKGFGIGNKLGNGNSEVVTQVANKENVNSNKTDIDVQKDKESKELPDKITVTIKEDKVYVEDKQIMNADELMSYIDAINTDSREYILKDENSILDTYEWTIKVFEDLKIKLTVE